MNNRLRKVARILAAILVVFVILLAGYVACVYLSYRSAERNARAFCDETRLGSDVSASVARAKAGKLLYRCDEGKGCTFFFPTITMFDVAVCTVATDGKGAVVSTHSEMQYD
jgi:hypothetical protein